MSSSHASRPLLLRQAVSSSSAATLSTSPTPAIPPSPFPIFTTINDFRRWRRQVQRDAILSSASFPQTDVAEDQRDNNEDRIGSVGFVPTMGALHQGHLDLVRRSLRENRHTVVSIFVNPAQFAPTEDLASYPRTLQRDLAALVALEAEEHHLGQKSRSEEVQPGKNGRQEDQINGQISAIFCPEVREMYPPLPGTQTAFTQRVDQQQGAFVEVQGLTDVLEGKSRPGFFRGVATVVTKLWHVVEPTRVYFGQKDIQQALILRALLTSLLFQSPNSSDVSRTFCLVPTTRDEQTGLALSSRNAYLGEAGKKWAPTLYRALSLARDVYHSSATTTSDRGEEGERGKGRRTKAVEEARRRAIEFVRKANEEAHVQVDKSKIRLELDYITFSSAPTLAEIATSDIRGGGGGGGGGDAIDDCVESDDDVKAEVDAEEDEQKADAMILSGAMWIIEGDRRTRMIDNLLLGKAKELLG